MDVIKILSVSLFILLSGCFFENDVAEKKAYVKAKSDEAIYATYDALQKLKRHKSNKYVIEFKQVAEAKKKLKLSEQALLDNDFLNAFNLSQESLSLFKSNEAKKVLIKSGKHLVSLIKSQYMVKQAFLNKPVNLDGQLNKLLSQDIADWNLIEINALFKQLTISANNLNKSINIINESQLALSVSEVKKWQDELTRQYEILHASRQFILAYSMAACAKKLKSINLSLAQDARPLFSLIKPENALNAMQPLFRKTFKEYIFYQNLMENLYLSGVKSELFQDALWYEPWRKLESDIFMPQENLETYSDMANLRTKMIDNIVAQYNIESPDLSDELASIEILNDKHKILHTTISSITSHQAILY